jgi:hypothetical protein
MHCHIFFHAMNGMVSELVVLDQGGSANSGRVSVGDAQIGEGNSTTRNLVFPITLNHPATSTVSVKYKLEGVSATGAGRAGAGVDFNNRSGALKTVTFTAVNGHTPVQKLVSVPVYPDSQIEPNEAFKVTLSNATGGYSLGRAVGTGSIVDDDSASGITVVIGDALTSEGDSGTGRTLKLPVTLAAKSTAEIALRYQVTGTGATYGKTASVAGADYGGHTAGTLRFRPAASTGLTPVYLTITVPIWPEQLIEGDETFTVTISPSTSLPAGVTLLRATATGTIANDD